MIIQKIPVFFFLFFSFFLVSRFDSCRTPTHPVSLLISRLISQSVNHLSTPEQGIGEEGKRKKQGIGKGKKEEEVKKKKKTEESIGE